MSEPSPLCGRLEEMHFPELLLEMSQRRETGILHLTREKIEKDIYFQDGRIVFAKSNDSDQRLGELLLRRGKISLKQLVDAAAKIVPGTRLGTILVQEGYLKAGELYQGVIDQVEEIVYSVFEWSEGSYEFHAGGLPGKEVITLSISTPDIIHLGIARIWRWSWIYKGVGPLDTVYALRKEWNSIARKMLVTPELQSIIDMLEEPMTLEEIVQESRASSYETCKLVWALLSIGMIAKTPRLELRLDSDDEDTAAMAAGPIESVPTETIPWEPRRLPPAPPQETATSAAEMELPLTAPVMAEPTPPVAEAPEPPALAAEEPPALAVEEPPALAVEEPPALAVEEPPAPAVEDAVAMPEVPLPAIPLVSEPGAAPTVEISFSDLAEFTDQAPAPPVEEPAALPEAAIRKDIACFNELHRYMFEMLRIEMGAGVANFLTKILKKAADQNPLVFEGVRMNEYGELDGETLQASIQGNLVDDYPPVLEWLLEEERSTAAAFLDRKRIDAIEAGLQKIRDKQQEAH